MTQEVRNTLPPLGTFFGMPACSNIDELSADIAFLGIPYEHGGGTRLVSGRKDGPKAIRDLKWAYYYESLVAGGESAEGWFDADAGKWQLRGVTMADCGDVHILPSSGGGGENGIHSDVQNCDRMTEVVRGILEHDAFPVVVGGDHTLAYPVVRAFDRFGPLDIVHFDAHHDWLKSYMGAKVRGNDGDCIIRCSELAFVNNITWIGLNGSWRSSRQDKEAYDAAVAYGTNIISAKRFRQMGISQVVESIPKAKNIYVTIDIDALDAAVAPGTVTVHPGGLSFLDLQQTLVGIPSRGRVVGFDVNGLVPARDPSGITSRLVVDLILDFLAAIFPS